MHKAKQYRIYLSQVDDFSKPKIQLEQYCTPPDIACELFEVLQFEHNAISQKVVGDFCCGTCMYSIAAAYFEPEKVVALDLDEDALAVAKENLEHYELSD